MENKEIVVKNQNQLAVRDVPTITTEILSLKEQAQNTAMLYYIEIGKRLTEAKQLLPHGKWGQWLKEEVDFEKSTANNLMKIYEEFGNSNFPALGNLGYTKTVMLLPLTPEAREELAKENDVENMTTRELEKAIKERDELQKRFDDLSIDKDSVKKELEESRKNADEARKKADKIAGDVLSLQRKLDKLKAENAKKDAEITDLKNNPTVSDEALHSIESKALEKAKKELEKDIEKYQNQLDVASKEQEDAKNEVDKYKQELAELEKKLRMSSADVVEFKTLFDRFQKDFQVILSVLTRIKGADLTTHDKLSSALKAFLERALQNDM